MSGNTSTRPPAPEALEKALRPRLFLDQKEEPGDTFAVLDGASCPDLLDHLYGDPRPEFICLYRGELEPDIAEVAPYLVRLEPDHPFTEWLLQEGGGKHWGIFARARAGLKTLRSHFRKLLVVKDPEDNQLYFRFYDPRVLSLYLPTCNQEELTSLFGPLRSYLCEDLKAGAILTFRLENHQLKVHTAEIAPPPPAR